MSLREHAISVVRTLRQANHVAYFAGGCVRDQLRGVDPKDYDVATSARPDEIRALFPHTIPVGAAFGVILVLIGDDKFEVATFRSDRDYSDGRRPDTVEFTDAEHDARRRDFTINGLFYDPIDDRVMDFVGGKADLEARVIRTIGVPHDRFAEDKLRLMRCVRFASTLGFDIDSATFAAVRELSADINAVSAERVRDELIKMFTGPFPGRAMDLLDRTGLLAAVLPEVLAMKGVQQPPQFHPEGDVFTHTRLMLDSLANPSSALVFACLLHDIGKPATFARTRERDGAERIRFSGHESVGVEVSEAILRRLRFSNDQRSRIIECVRHHMQFKDVRRMARSTLRRMLARETFEVELELHRTDCLASHADLDAYNYLKTCQAEFASIPPKPPRLVSGHDLLAIGFREGPHLGRVLRQIEELQLEDKLRTKAEAIEFAERHKTDEPVSDRSGP